MSNIKLIYECPECETNIPLSVSPIVPAYMLSPPEGGEIEPSRCPVCSYEFREAPIHRLADEQRKIERDRAREERE